MPFGDQVEISSGDSSSSNTDDCKTESKWMKNSITVDQPVSEYDSEGTCHNSHNCLVILSIYSLNKCHNSHNCLLLYRCQIKRKTNLLFIKFGIYSVGREFLCFSSIPEDLIGLLA